MFDWHELNRFGMTFQHRLRAVIAANKGEVETEMISRALARLLREKPTSAQPLASEAFKAVFGSQGDQCWACGGQGYIEEEGVDCGHCNQEGGDELGVRAGGFVITAFNGRMQWLRCSACRAEFQWPDDTRPVCKHCLKGSESYGDGSTLGEPLGSRVRAKNSLGGDG